MTDILAEAGLLFLGSRLKRVAERMQADAAQVLRDAGLPVQPGQLPLLTALDLRGPMSVGEAVDALGVSQPAVTRSLPGLVALGLIETARDAGDQRLKRVSLTEAGYATMARAKAVVWPHVGAVVEEMCASLSGPLLDQIDALEAMLAEQSLDRRVAASRAGGVTIRDYSDELAVDFDRINAEWIEAMFEIEAADREVLENPREAIIDGGGAILFAETDDLGVVGTCALRKSSDGSFELTKMGVLERARGRKVGELLLAATLARAAELGAETIYLLTNRKCAAAIHLYEKVGFVHDAEIMAAYRARYLRCDVAMRYRPPA